MAQLNYMQKCHRQRQDAEQARSERNIESSGNRLSVPLSIEYAAFDYDAEQKKYKR